MRKLWVIPLGLFLVLAPARAQHKVTLTWTNSPDTNNTFVYRLTGPCPNPLAGFTKLTAVPITTATYADSAVNAGTTYAYYATAFLNNLESVPSNCISATVPVTPPSGLSITSVAINIIGNTETVTAQWVDPSGTQQAFKFSNGTSFVAQGLTSDPSGNFAQQWTGPAGTPIIFMVQNAAGANASQAAR